MDAVECFGYVGGDDEPHVYIEALLCGSPISVHVYFDEPFEDAEPLTPDEAFAGDY